MNQDMSNLVLMLPALLNDKDQDFKKLFDLRNQIEVSRADVDFDFSKCRFLRPNAVAFLGGTARLIESLGRKVAFDWDSLHNPAVLANMRQNGFAGTFGHPVTGWEGNSIPYREDRSLDMNAIMDYLTYNWLGKGWIHISDRLRDAIAGRMWEIYNNAFEHSGSKIGVFSCGQHFKKRNELILTVIDFGLGIPENVKTFFRKYVDEESISKLTGAACLRWAFARGNSTITDSVARGLGLDLLKEFVCLNQGKLEVYSNDAYALIDNAGERFVQRDVSFIGTIMHITLRCDERLYSFKDEAVG